MALRNGKMDDRTKARRQEGLRCEGEKGREGRGPIIVRRDALCEREGTACRVGRDGERGERKRER
jgi:hypothetical protein